MHASFLVCHQALKATTQNLYYRTPGVFQVGGGDDVPVGVLANAHCLADLAAPSFQSGLDGARDIRCRDAYVEDACFVILK
jgi:hypothetical protein